MIRFPRFSFIFLNIASYLSTHQIDEFLKSSNIIGYYIVEVYVDIIRGEYHWNMLCYMWGCLVLYFEYWSGNWHSYNTILKEYPENTLLGSIPVKLFLWQYFKSIPRTFQYKFIKFSFRILCFCQCRQIFYCIPVRIGKNKIGIVLNGSIRTTY